MDPYVLFTPSLIDSKNSSPDLKINNLVFMDDSTLIFSSKVGMESMLSIIEEFYQINNTSANHNKYVVPFISITSISMTTSFHFLGVWFNIKSSHDFKAYYDNLTGRRGPGRIPHWYKDIQQSIIVPDFNNYLLDKFIFAPEIGSSFYELEPCLSSPPTTKNWIVTLDDFGSPIFGKQLLVQAGRGTYSIVHWVSPNCESSPGELIKLSPCPGCAAHISLPPSKKRNADLTLCILTVSLQQSLILPTTNKQIRQDGVRLYYSRLNFASDSSPTMTTVASATPTTVKLQLLRSLINLGTPDVSMGWSWMQIVPDAGFPNSIATYAHGIIQDNPSSSRAEAAAIYVVGL
ncbi:hypothetical protein RhiirC2_774686, partial [Rhizophagus irregularis]